MASLINHEVSEIVDLFMSQGNGSKVSDCTDLGLQSMTSTMPNGEPTHANGQQNRAGRHPCRRHASAKARRRNRAVRAKNPRARDYYGRFIGKNGNHEVCKARVILERDSKGRFVGKGNKKDMVGDPYYDIMNTTEAPNFTTLLRIMNAKHHLKIARLHDPDFTSLMSAMNNISYKAVDDGPYDALKVLLQADAGIAE